MLKNVEEISPTRKRLKIEIPPDAIEKEISGELEKLRQKTKIPGFRAGKAPISLIEKRFGKEVEGEALQKLIPRFYAESVTEAALKPISNPVFEQADEFKRNTPFNMTIMVEVLPKIEELKYEGLKVKDMEVKVEEKELDDVLENLRQDKAVFEPTEEPLANGDLAVMDYKIEEENKSFEGQVFKLGSPNMPEEFSKGLTGKKKGESLEMKVKFPEDYGLKEAAGRELTFQITLKDTKKMKLPELTDEFAKDFGNDTLGELREHVKGEIEKSKKNALRKMQRAEIVKTLLETHQFDIPEGLVELEVKRLVEEGMASGNSEEPAVLKEKMREPAVRNVKASILLDLIGEKETVRATEEDVKNKIAEMSQRTGLPPENIMKYYVSRHGSLDSLRHAVFEEKVLDLLIDKAELEKVNEHNTHSD